MQVLAIFLHFLAGCNYQAGALPADKLLRSRTARIICDGAMRGNYKSGGHNAVGIDGSAF